MKENSKIRDGKTQEVANEIIKLMYRQDISDMYYSFVLDNNLNKDENIMIRGYVDRLVANEVSYVLVNREISYINDYKDSYHYFAKQFHEQISLTKSFSHNFSKLHEITKKNKLRLNEMIIVAMRIANTVAYKITVGQLH